MNRNMKEESKVPSEERDQSVVSLKKKNPKKKKVGKVIERSKANLRQLVKEFQGSNDDSFDILKPESEKPEKKVSLKTRRNRKIGFFGDIGKL